MTPSILLDDIWELARKIQAKEISPVEITSAAIAHAEQMQPVLNSFITLTPDLALTQARDMELRLMKGEYCGPLHGVPIGIKDMLLTRGIRTTDGGKTLEHYVPTEDAHVVERVRDAGAVILGKENMHEHGLGFTSDNPWYGRVHNPWDVSRIAGGSSGGSAANVAAFVTYGSVGTDGGGSIRMPSAACGVVGLKPTFGRVSSRGGLEGPDPSTYHVGPHTRSVRDCAIMLSAIAGYDPRDPTTVPVDVEAYESRLQENLKDLVIGVPTNHFFDSPLDGEIEEAVRAAIKSLEDLGLTSRPVTIPYVEFFRFITAIANVSYCIPYEDTLRRAPNEISEPERLWMLSRQFVLAQDLLRSQQLRRRLQDEFASLMQDIDVLATPTTPALPWEFDAEHVLVGGTEIDTSSVPDGVLGWFMGRNTGIANLIGAPAISVPCGFSASGLPIGLQLIGRPWEDSLVMRVAHQYEQARALAPRIPPIVQLAMDGAPMESRPKDVHVKTPRKEAPVRTEGITHEVLSLMIKEFDLIPMPDKEIDSILPQIQSLVDEMGSARQLRLDGVRASHVFRALREDRDSRD